MKVDISALNWRSFKPLPVAGSIADNR
jgi:hypothetical protein